MSSHTPTTGLLEQQNASEHSRLVRAAARLRSFCPQFGWPSLLAFLLGPISRTEMSMEWDLGIKAFGCFLVVSSLALRLATRGYHRKSGFVINGPYRYIRNPVEAGAVLGISGAGILLKLPLWYVALIMAFAMAFLSFASLSYEKDLLGKLQGNYYRYTRRVKRWIPSFLPGVNRVNRDYSFLSALKEERDSLLWFAAWVGVYALRSHFFVQLNWW